jgi:hypothetical protein
MDSILPQFPANVFQYENSFHLIQQAIKFTATAAIGVRRSHRRIKELQVKSNWFRRTEDNGKT